VCAVLQVRQGLAKLGYKTLDEVIGRADLLVQRSSAKLTKTSVSGSWRAKSGAQGLGGQSTVNTRCLSSSFAEEAHHWQELFMTAWDADRLLPRTVLHPAICRAWTCPSSPPLSALRAAPPRASLRCPLPPPLPTSSLDPACALP
jgi:hypothetical protein